MGQCVGKACGEVPAEKQLRAPSHRPHNVSVSGVPCTCIVLNQQDLGPASPLCSLTASAFPFKAEVFLPVASLNPHPGSPPSSLLEEVPGSQTALSWSSSLTSLTRHSDVTVPADSPLLSEYTLLSSLCSKVSWGELVPFQDGPFQVSQNAPPWSTTS